jgi:hypothetical protein
VRLFPQPDLFARSDAHDEQRGRAIGRLHAIVVQITACVPRIRGSNRLVTSRNLLTPALALVMGYIVGIGGSTAERHLRTGRDAALAVIDATFQKETPVRDTTGTEVRSTHGWDQVPATRASQLPLRPFRSIAATQPANQLRSVRPTEPLGGSNSNRPAVPVPTSQSRLIVTSVPSGARVTVNGIGWGATPLTIRHLEPGPKRIRVSMDGYRSAEHTVTLVAGAPVQARLQLRRLDFVRAMK